MSKGIGQKIAIKFTEVLRGDVTGLVPTPVAPGNYFRPLGTATGSSQYSSSYAPTRAFDGNVTGSYWYTRTSGDQWVKIELAESTWVYGFRWYVDSYRPNGFNFQGSNDGAIWEDILTNNSPNETGWHEFLADSPKQHKYYRWTITSRYSSYLYVYEIELLSATGNDGALTITGEEYQYVNGPLILKEYKAISVERHPDYSDDKHLLVTLHPQSRFNNVEGPLTIQYDQSHGSLRGRGGPVEGFTEIFTPTDLVPKPNPGVAESVEVSAEANVNFTKVTYNQRYSDEQITVSVNATVDFIYVGVVNP